MTEKKKEERRKEKERNPARSGVALQKTHGKGVRVDIFLVENKEEVVDGPLPLDISKDIVMEKLDPLELFAGAAQ